MVLLDEAKTLQRHLARTIEATITSITSIAEKKYFSATL